MAEHEQSLKVSLRATGLEAKRDAVEHASQAVFRLNQQARIREFRGKFDWLGDLDALRTAK